VKRSSVTKSCSLISDVLIAVIVKASQLFGHTVFINSFVTHICKLLCKFLLLILMHFYRKIECYKFYVIRLSYPRSQGLIICIEILYFWWQLPFHVITARALQYNDKNVSLDGKKYKVTQGLWELLTKSKPDKNVVTFETKQAYKQIPLQSNEHRVNHGPTGKIKASKHRPQVYAIYFATVY